MYKYTPPKNSKADTAVLALFITAIACFAVASFSRMYAGLIQALGVIFIGAALFLFCRYTLSVYIYLIEDGNFVVLRTLGKKISPICSVSLKTGIAIVKMPHTAAEKEEYRKKCGNVRSRFNYCRTLSPENAYAFVLDFNGRKTELLFEPNEEFLHSFEMVFANVRREYLRELYGDDGEGGDA